MAAKMQDTVKYYFKIGRDRAPSLYKRQIHNKISASSTTLEILKSKYSRNDIIYINWDKYSGNCLQLFIL